MSSAVNHRKRSHRSEARKRGAFGGMNRKTVIYQVRAQEQRSLRERVRESWARMRESKRDKEAG